jgi:hypothetical protein
MTTIAPAALACTFVTSIAGAATYGLLALTTTGDIAPAGDWDCSAALAVSSAATSADAYNHGYPSAPPESCSAASR